MTMTMQTATEIVEALRAHGCGAQDGARPMLALAEEAGEFVGAYRRWTGRARRPGLLDDVQAELADVVITCYVSAAELGIDLDAALTAQAPRMATLVGAPGSGVSAETDARVLAVYLAVARFVQADVDELPATRRATLAKVVCTAYTAASALTINLDAAITAKLAEIFSRGWRAPAQSPVDDQAQRLSFPLTDVLLTLAHDTTHGRQR